MIDLQLLAEELEQDFVEEYLKLERTEVLAPPVPVDVGMLCEELYPDDVDEPNAYRLVGDVAGLLPLVTFNWEEDGATPFSMTLDLLALGDLVYLTISPDDAIHQSWEAIAAMRNYTPTILSPLFLDLLKDNGTRLGVDLLSSLPTRIESKFLKPISFVVGFREYLTWDDERSSGAWEAAAGYLPESLQHNRRLMDAARAVAAGGSGEVRDEFLASYVVATFDGVIT